MNRSRILLYGCGIVGAGSFLFAAYAQKTPPLPKWSADKALVKNLTEVVEIEGFSIQPPRGYEMQEGNAPEGMKAMGWVGEQRSDGVRPSLALIIINIPKAEAKKYTLEQVTEKIAGGIKLRRTEWQQGKIEKGVINGSTFARLRWTGIAPSGQLKMQGFIYTVRNGNAFLSFTSQDAVLEAKQSLALAETSVFTFKKLP